MLENYLVLRYSFTKSHSLPKKWLMKNLVWQQNHHQKVFYRLYICAEALDVLKSEQTSLLYSASYLNLWGIRALFRRG